MRLLLIFLVFFLGSCDQGGIVPFEKKRELVIVTKAPSAGEAQEDIGGTAGFDRDLVELLAQELGIKSRFITAADEPEVLKRLQSGEATVAAAWLSPVDESGILASAPYFESGDVLVTHEATLPLHRLGQLAQRRVHVIAGSRQEAVLQQMAKKNPKLRVVAHKNLAEIDLLERVAAQRYEVALVSDTEFEIGINLYPELQNTLKIGPSRPIVWLFAPNADPELIARANGFLYRMEASGELARLKDRYFGHVDGLTQLDTTRFIELMQERLPKFRAMFQSAQIATGIDWRLLAALAYQESQWNPLATSPTGVRGMMMLTGETADILGVSNRLDPAQSIAAGAQYLANLRDALPPEITEPDRTWLALAAYNLGLGHLKAARHIAGTLNADPDSWYAMKKVLPLLAQPRYYQRLKSGKGRGGEAVILVENIRVYADILYRREEAFRASELTPALLNSKPRL